jgi:hypothetical protein
MVNIDLSLVFVGYCRSLLDIDDIPNGAGAIVPQCPPLAPVEIH